MLRASSSVSELWSLCFLRRGPALLLGTVLTSILSRQSQLGMRWVPGFLRSTSAFLQPLGRGKPPTSHTLLRHRKLAWARPAPEALGQWRRLAGGSHSPSLPLPSPPNSLALACVSCGLVWLTYFMLLQAAFLQSYGKNVCTLPRTPAFHPLSTLN